MSILPKTLENLIEQLGKLPGVGPRSAERFAIFILRHEGNLDKSMSEAIAQLKPGIKICPKTFMLINNNESVSRLYDDNSRDKSVVAVVEDPLDVVAIENTGAYHGTYHVIGGVLSPIDGIGPEQLRIRELLARIKPDGIKEIILATNASIEGESTALYINKQVSAAYPEVKISRLARGLPAGVDLEYADQVTLSRAIEERQKL